MTDVCKVVRRMSLCVTVSFKCGVSKYDERGGGENAGVWRDAPKKG